MKEINTRYDIFDEISEIPTIEDGILSIVPEDSNSINTDEIKKSAEMLYTLNIRILNDKNLIRTVKFFMKELENTYNSLFSLYHSEILLGENAPSNNSQISWESIYNEYYFRIYYTLKKGFNVTQFHSFNNSLMSLCVSLKWNKSNFEFYVKGKNISFIFNDANFQYQRSNSSIIKYFNACFFLSNDKFDEYINKFTSKNIIEIIRREFGSFDLFHDYLMTNTLYFYVPIIQTCFTAEKYIPIYKSKYLKGCIVDEMNDMGIINKIYMDEHSHFIIASINSIYQYNINDFKTAIKSPVLVQEKKLTDVYENRILKAGEYCIDWHEKPFITSFKNVYDNIIFKFPAIAVEVSLLK